jgi:DNA repair protein SbcC/Rad50
MIVRRLTITNFRRFPKLDLTDIPLGLTGIIGKNGSGKSTILEAIGWALYGTHALTAKTGKDGVKMQNVAPDEICEVVLEFEMEEDSYRVVRCLKGKTAIAHAFVYKNGNKNAVAEREDGVNHYIAKLFGMDRATFFASVFAQQKELDMLTSKTPAERQRIIRRLLRIDLIDEALKVIRQDSRLKKETAGNLQGMMLDVAMVRTEIDGLAKQQKEMIAKKKELETTAEELKATLKEAKNHKQEMDVKRKADKQVENRLTRTEKEIQGTVAIKEKRAVELERLEAEKKELLKITPREKEYVATKVVLEKLENIRGLFEEKKTLEKDLTERIEDKTRVIKARDDLTGKLAAYKDLGSRKEKIAAELKNCRTSLQKISKEIDTLDGKIQVCRQSIAELEDKKKQVVRLGPKSKCPACFRDLGENFEKILEHFDAETANQQKNIKGYTVTIKELREVEAQAGKRLEDTESALEKIRIEEKKEDGFRVQLESAEKSLKSITESINRRKTRLGEIGALDFSEVKYEALKKKSKDLTAVHERIMELGTKTARIPELVREIKGLDKRLEELTGEKKSAEKERDDIGFSEKELVATDKAHEGAQSKVYEQDKKIDETKHGVEMLKLKIDQKEESLKQQKELREKLESAQMEVKQLELLADVMDKFQQDLSGRIQPMLVARTSQLVTQTSGGRYSAIDLDDDYNIYIYDGGERFLIKRFSGGEQDLVSLCLRIAISQVISEQNGGKGINFIALDEIFGSQDVGRKENILTALSSLSGQFRQIFLITHHEDLKDSMQHVLVVEEAEEGVSTAAFV